MLQVKVLGPGCANCKRLAALVQKVADEHHVSAEIQKVTDYAEIMHWNVLSTPGLVVNDVLVVSGRIPSERELTAWLTS